MNFLDVIDKPSCNKFNALIMQKPTIVQFFSTGCGYCDQLKPEWNSLQEMLKEKYEGDMMLARVREDMMGYVKCDKNIEGFPTIFVLKKGKKQKEFEGNRNAGELLKFIAKHIRIEKKGQKGGSRRGHRHKRRRRRRKTKRKKRRTNWVASLVSIISTFSRRRKKPRRTRKRKRRIKRRRG